MRCYFLQKTRPSSGDSEPLSDSGILQALAIRQDKQPLSRVPAVVDKLLNPRKCPSVEEHGPFLITLPDDAGFPRLEIDGRSLERKRFRNPHARPQQHLHKTAEAKRLHLHPVLARKDGNCGEEFLDLLGRQEYDFPARHARRPDELRIQYLQSQAEAAEAEKTSQRVDYSPYSGRSGASCRHCAL